MTVAALPSVVTYIEDGVSTSFPVPFRFKSKIDLTVERIIGGVVQPLVLDVDYTVSGGATDAGGTIARSVATNGATLRIRRETARVQPMVYTTGDRFPARSHEEALDRQMLIAQEQQDGLDETNARAVMVPTGEVAPALVPRALRRGGNKILGPDPVSGDIAVLDGSAFQGDPGGNSESVGTFAAAQSMILDPSGGVKQVRFTDRGKTTFEQFAGAIDAAGVGIDQFSTPDGKRWRYPPLASVSARAMGAAEGGDDRLAIARAMVLSRDTVQDPAKGDGRVVQQRGVVLETGTYSAGGILHDIFTTQNATGTSELLLEAAPGARPTIVIPPGKYFMEISGRVQGARIKGIRFVGGKGAFKFVNASNNVNLPLTFEDCVFLDYTECAIGNLSDDSPYWHIVGCRFSGTTTSKGIAIGGYLDGCVIERNVFDRNRYHIQIGPRLSGSFLIEMNDFIKVEGYFREADILICPNLDSYSFGNSAGQGAVIRANKFGNENLQRYEDRIVIANLDPATGIDRLSQRHSLVDIAGYASGITIADNRLATKFIAGSDLGDGNDGNFIHSYIRATRNFTLQNNKQEGGRFRWYVFHEIEPDPFDYHVSQNWSVSLDPSNAFQYGVSNRSVGRILDPYGAMPSDRYVAQPSPVEDDDQILFFTGDTRADIVDHTSVPTVDGPVDRYGAPIALVTLPTADDYIAMPLLALDYTGAQFWWSFDIAPVADATRRLREVNIAVFNRDTNQLAAIRQVQIMRPHWECRIIPSSPPVGTANQFLVSHSYVNAGQLPISPSHLKTIGGRWNTPHMIMGPFHFWVDDNTRLRIKGDGAPTGPFDGQLV
jgi:hypothetical protein